MSIQVAAFTHRPTLSRMPCPICLLDTLHKCWRCIHCGHDSSPKVVKRPAFGAKLVLGRRRSKP
jgi:hypothetical protein